MDYFYYSNETCSRNPSYHGKVDELKCMVNGPIMVNIIGQLWSIIIDHNYYFESSDCGDR